MKINNLSKEEVNLMIESFYRIKQEQSAGKNILEADTYNSIMKFLQDTNQEFTKEEYAGIIIAFELYFVTRVWQNQEKYYSIMVKLKERNNKLYGGV